MESEVKHQDDPSGRLEKRKRKKINKSKRRENGVGEIKEKICSKLAFLVNRNGDRGLEAERDEGPEGREGAPTHRDSNPGVDLAPLPPLLSLVPCAPQRPGGWKLMQELPLGPARREKDEPDRNFLEGEDSHFGWKEKAYLAPTSEIVTKT